MAQIRWTLEAQRWLEDIFEFISVENPEAASRTISGIFDRAQILADHPEVGYRYSVSNRYVRILLYGHYRITYLVSDDGNVDILGVFHSALDLNRYEL
ncbi:MAG: type II toxin-antitoxin system RelE/ParE family toxin [Steroidobacteraceae bacterium]